MFAVIFEVWPDPSIWDTYLEEARILRPELEQIDGFIDNERWRDQADDHALLSLSRWRDEKALVRWRTKGIHHKSQELGRDSVFIDYHLRVGEFAGDDAARSDETETGPAKAASISEIPASADLLPPAEAAVLDHRRFTHLNDPDRSLLLVTWTSISAASGWIPDQATSHGIVRVIRDYGLEDRREAPQYYPPVKR